MLKLHKVEINYTRERRGNYEKSYSWIKNFRRLKRKRGDRENPMRGYTQERARVLRRLTN